MPANYSFGSGSLSMTRRYLDKLERTQKALVELDGAKGPVPERPSSLRPRQTGGELKRVTTTDVLAALRSERSCKGEKE